MKTLKFVGVALAGAIAVFAIAIYLLLDATCGNDVISDQPSPDGRYRAIAFERSCGAIGGSSTQITVIRSWWYLRNVEGNVFVADSDHGKTPLEINGWLELKIQWESPTLLAVSYHPDARVFKSEQKVGSIAVKYEKFSVAAANNSLQGRRP